MKHRSRQTCGRDSTHLIPVVLVSQEGSSRDVGDDMCIPVHAHRPVDILCMLCVEHHKHLPMQCTVVDIPGHWIAAEVHRRQQYVQACTQGDITQRNALKVNSKLLVPLWHQQQTAAWHQLECAGWLHAASKAILL